MRRSDIPEYIRAENLTLVPIGGGGKLYHVQPDSHDAIRRLAREMRAAGMLGDPTDGRGFQSHDEAEAIRYAIEVGLSALGEE